MKSWMRKRVILIGNLGDAIKMHYFEGGNSIGRFPIATSESYTSKQTGEKIITTDWHNIVVRNKLAEICEKYLSKGDKVYVEGKLKRYSTEIYVNEMTFLTTKKSLETTNNPQQNQQTAAKPKTVATEKEDDLPF